MQHRERLHDLGHIDEAACRRFQATVEFAGRKWTSAILLAGVRGARRFSEYRAAVTGISDRLLTARLRELEAEGLIERHVRATTPGHDQLHAEHRGAPSHRGAAAARRVGARARPRQRAGSFVTLRRTARTAA